MMSSLPKNIQNSFPIGCSFTPVLSPEEDQTINSYSWLDVTRVSKDCSWDFKEKLPFQDGKLLCIHRWKIWWTIPRILKSPDKEGSVPAQTFLLIGKLSDGQLLLLLPLIDHHMEFTLEGSANILTGGPSSDSRLVLHGHENSPEAFDEAAVSRSSTSYYRGQDVRRAMLVGYGPRLYPLLAGVFRLAKTHMQEQLSLTLAVPIPAVTKPQLHRTAGGSGEGGSAGVKVRKSRRRGPGPAFIDSFGWCSWDSFYTDLSLDQLLKGLTSFEDTGVQPRFLILDDGWQDTNVNTHTNGFQWGGRLRSFGANFKFSPGYGPLRQKLSQDQDTLAYTKVGEAGNMVSWREEQQRALAQGMPPLVPVPPNGLLAWAGQLTPQLLGQQFGLQELVAAAKRDYGIQHLLVWHTLSGYWAGVEPTAAAALNASEERTNQTLEGISLSEEVSRQRQELTADQSEWDQLQTKISYPALPPSLQRIARSGDLPREPFTTGGVGLVEPAQARRFFLNYHRGLRAMGVDGVKVDAQAVVPLLKAHGSTGWQTVAAFHSALQQSVGTHFTPELSNETSSDPMAGSTVGSEQLKGTEVDSYNTIHCMCHSQGTLLSMLALYQSPLECLEEGFESGEDRDREDRRLRRVALIRGSDDFMPAEPASHGTHLFANALNALFLTHLGLQDWDMFQSTGLGGERGSRTARLHAAARAICGGPVYVSDRPGVHDPTLLQTIAFPTGAIPRAVRNVRPVEDFVFHDPQRETRVPLVLQNLNPAGGAVVGLFHVFGSLLENDVDFWRTVRFEEVQWTGAARDTLLELSEQYKTKKQQLEVKVRQEDMETDVVKVAPDWWFLDPAFKDYLTIDAPASPLFVEEIALTDSISKAPSQPGQPYVGFRHSDRGFFYLHDLKESVPIHLEQVFDFDIVTFAPVKHWEPDTAKPWVAVVGACGLLNAGGAVLAVELVQASPNNENHNTTSTTSSRKTLRVELLGGWSSRGSGDKCTYSLVCSPDVNHVAVRTIYPLKGESKGLTPLEATVRLVSSLKGGEGSEGNRDFRVVEVDVFVGISGAPHDDEKALKDLREFEIVLDFQF